MLGYYNGSEINEIVLVTEVNDKRFISEIVKVLQVYVILDIKYSITKDNNKVVYTALILCQKIISQTPPTTDKIVTEEKIDETVKE